MRDRPLDTTRRMDCPDAEALVAMGSDGLSLERRAEIANHAAECGPCHAALDVLIGSHAAGVPADSMASTVGVDRAAAGTSSDPAGRSSR